MSRRQASSPPSMRRDHRVLLHPGPARVRPRPAARERGAHGRRAVHARGGPGPDAGQRHRELVLSTQAGFPSPWLDVVFGSLATLLGAAWTWRFAARPAARARRARSSPTRSSSPRTCRSCWPGRASTRIPLLGIDVEAPWLWMYVFGVVAICDRPGDRRVRAGLPLAALLRRAGAGALGDESE